LLRSNILKNFRFYSYKSKFKKPPVLLKNMEIKRKDFYSDFYKFVDLRHKSQKIFYNNRILFKNILFTKKLRQYQLTKIFSKIIKHSFLNTKLMFEFSLYNILIRAGFAITFDETFFLIKNNLVFVNGVLQTNPYFVVSQKDVVSLMLSKKHYAFHKNNLNKKLKLTFFLGYRIWRINRFKNNFYKQSSNRIPDWVNRLTFFYEDVPSYLEVDYSILACSIIKIPSKFSSHNFYFNKFINFFMMRQYNWKYLI
jgi:ribosomal protein S4